MPFSFYYRYLAFFKTDGQRQLKQLQYLPIAIDSTLLCNYLGSMTNALDYVSWRGDLPFSLAGLNEVDFLLFAEFVYAPIENWAKGNPKAVLDGKGPVLASIAHAVYPKPLPKKSSYVFKPRYDLWMMLEGCRRFEGTRLDFFESNFEPENAKQFAAAVFSITEDGKNTAIVAFRGTDATVTGWKEDFDMAYKSPIPAQADAVRFLETVLDGNYGKVYVCGHSKGGNLAMYASACCSRPDKITAVYSFDGPGLSDEILDSDGWKSIQDRIHSYVPESSVIGMLLGNSISPEVVKSDNVSLMQHNPFYWHVLGTSFVRSEETTFSSRFLDGTLHEFMSECTLEQKELLVKTTFEVIEASGAEKTKDIMKGLVKNLPKLKQTLSGISEEDRKMLRQMMHIMRISGSKALQSLK